jgi:signal transduction histidine kinase
VAIEYSGLDLSLPKRVHFRYRLDGFDRDWIDAGSRREAFYTNLPPGTYKFHVTAASGAGIWNTTDAAVAFAVAPTFLESIWFKILAGLVLAGLAWLAYTLRIRQETARLRSRFEVRSAERERIAREIHDTLLQGCHGLMMRLQSIAYRIPPGDTLRKDIEDALDRADAVLADGRTRVQELRISTATGDFAQSLTETASNIIGGDAPRFLLTVEGEPRALNALVGEEVLRIFEEAVRNVLKHANAKSIEAHLVYGRRAFGLSLRDDGTGIAKSTVAAGGGSGHFGLVGMRERADRIGGHLRVTGHEAGGTEVMLLAPAKIAYKRRSTKDR